MYILTLFYSIFSNRTEIKITFNLSKYQPDLRIAERTLMAAGFIPVSSERKPGYGLLNVIRIDEFGASHKYTFAIAENELKKESVEAVQIASEYYNSKLIIIGNIGFQCDIPTMDWIKFINILGGSIFSINVFEPAYHDQLNELGQNKLPGGLEGIADDLFEQYVKKGLEFIFGVRVIQYGQERNYEALPDGIVLSEQEFSALYDAKAYENGYKVNKDTIRQFSSYVRDFNKRYNNFLSRINCFIVISSSFPHRENTLLKRSQELYAECGVQLTFLTSGLLSEMIKLLSGSTRVRRSINWSLIFSGPFIEKKRIVSEIQRIKNDNIIPRK